MPQRRKRRRNFPLEVLEEIAHLAEKGVNAAQITRRLELDARFADGRLPAERTVQDIVRGLAAPRDESGRWTFNEADPDDAALILPVLAAVIQETEGRRTYFTRAQAEFIGRIRRLAPELDGFRVYRLARLYLFFEARGEPARDVEAFLAFAPWRSEEQREAYQRALENEWIPEITSMAPGLWRAYGHEGP